MPYKNPNHTNKDSTLPELIDFKEIRDNRGCMIALEQLNNIPFEIKRVYYMYDLNSKTRRGEHAHRQTDRILICLRGSCIVDFDDTYNKYQVSLNSPSKGVRLLPYIWHSLFNFSEDCLIMVLANKLYEESDYIRDYQTFKKIINERHLIYK